MSTSRFAPRRAVLTAAWLSLIFFGFAFFAHKRLHDKDLQRTRGLARRLEAHAEVAHGVGLSAAQGPVDAMLAELAQPVDAREPEARAFYDDGELEAYVAARLRGPFEQPAQARSLTAPGNLRGRYAAGAVTLAWDPGAMNTVLASTLARQGTDLSVAFRIYRASAAADPEWIASLPWGETSWEDHALPLAASRLSYEVWAVLLRHGPLGEVLVAAERSEPVTVLSPEHFTLDLQGGDADEALFTVAVELPAARDRVLARAGVGQEIRAGELATGLVVQSIQISKDDRLSTQRRLLFTSDGSLVLDPETHQPRTTQTQVLLPVRRLSVVLADAAGTRRELAADLP